MQEGLIRCWVNDIVTVVGAGNGGNDGISLDQMTPQNLGRPYNPLITVGGVDGQGQLSLSPMSSFDVGQGGSISVYAMSEKVRCASCNGGDTMMKGSSMAAPAVAGLAAYFASLPSLAGELRRGNVAQDMKDYIVRHSHELNTLPIPYARYSALFLEHSYRIEKVNVAYNRAPEGLCGAHKPAGDA